MYNYMYTGCIFYIIGYAGIPSVLNYIIVTKTNGRHPITRLWISYAEVRGNVVTRMVTQEQYNNQDRNANEFVPPRTWTPL